MKYNQTLFTFLLFMASTNFVNAQTSDLTEAKNNQLFLVGITYYVNKNVATAGNGTSWNTAFDNLQDALAISIGGDQIWVAQGVYYPDIGASQVNNAVASTFTLNMSVKLYGGFDATETSLAQRNPEVNLTILSGDIDGNDTVDSNGITASYTDLLGSNAYHLITIPNVSVTNQIDGFTLTAGWAAGVNPDNQGATIACTGNNMVLKNVVIQGNQSNTSAALLGCTFTVRNSTFIANKAGSLAAISTSGGNYRDCIFIDNTSSQASLFDINTGTFDMNRVEIVSNLATSRSTIRLQGNTVFKFDNVLFRGNRSSKGTAMRITTAANGSLSNVTVTGNLSTSSGGAIDATTLGNITVNNSIFMNNRDLSGLGSLGSSITHSGSGLFTVNSSILQGSGGSVSWNATTLADGGGNLDVNPFFILDTDPFAAPTSIGDSHLTDVSMAIDTGDNSLVTTSKDLDGKTRIFSGTVDMGAFEFIPQQVFSDGFE